MTFNNNNKNKIQVEHDSNTHMNTYHIIWSNK